MYFHVPGFVWSSYIGMEDVKFSVRLGQDGFRHFVSEISVFFSPPHNDNLNTLEGKFNDLYSSAWFSCSSADRRKF